MQKGQIDCFKCRYFYVTWDPKFPRGCKAYQFKTAMLPSADVLRASGNVCLRFEQKP